MITTPQKIQFQKEKIAQYDAELFQLSEKIEEIEAAKSICNARLRKLEVTEASSKGKRKEVADESASTDS